jgi:undecaprenyl-diphosphatase
MLNTSINELFERVDYYETRFCVGINSGSRKSYIRYFFRVISRLGDGIFWYALILYLPYINGDQGWKQALHILLTGLIGLLLYKLLKNYLVRERPYINCNIIYQAAPALDRYSFPSGHTLHAVLFSTMLSTYLLEFTSVVWGFASLVAMSRVVLGLHYPSDVVAGALIGFGLATASLHLV